MASKAKCKYGAKCFRKNEQHLRDYSHPVRDDDDEPKKKRQKKETKDITKDTKDISTFFAKKTKEPEKVLTEIDSDHDDEEEPGTSATDVVSNDYSISGSSDEDEEAPDSPVDIKENIKQKFSVEMPDDFYDFWEFCKNMNSKCPQDALEECLGLKLVGPFDILAGKHKGVTKNKHGKKPNFLLHWRYYYDPPEFLTVVKGDSKTQFHLGYYRDDPSDMPNFVASNEAKESGVITCRGPNLFAATRWFIQDKMKSKNTRKKDMEQLECLLEDISDKANELNHCLDMKNKAMKDRDKKVVCKTFHKAGIVVPVDSNEVGYREVPETTGDLKKMFKAVVEAGSEAEREKNMDPIQELITLIQFANDECDYGEGLELGLDMFTFGGEALHQMISHLLPLAYQLLNRDIYANIIEAHLRHRKRGSDLSQID